MYHQPLPFKQARKSHFALWIAMIAVIACFNFSCKKEKDKDDNGDDNRKITDVVPTEYLKTITSNGMKIYDGNTPPNVEGKFKISPYRFDYDNHNMGGYPSPGTIMSDLIIEMEKQSGQNIRFSFGGNYLSGIEIEDPFMTGSGNNFSIAFQVHIMGGIGATFIFPYEYIFSGIVDGSNIKDLKMARVGLGKTNSAGFSVAGNVDLYSDADGITERIP